MLAAAVDAYVAMRRAAGFTFQSEARQLASFAAFAEGRAESHVRVSLAVEWAALARSMPQRARRLGHVIRLARYLRAEDRAHEVPPAVFGAEKRSRPTPYILTPDQIRQLVVAASRSGYRTLRRDTYRTFFALLAATGLRASEAIHLRLDDITPPDGLVIRCSKFRKSRLVPLHETARAGLERYLQRRLAYAPAEPHVFVSLRGKPLLLHDVEVAFRTAARAIGLPDSPRARPTRHSLRHAFAVQALQACPDGRDAITRHMLALSTYLGHAKVADTYWYLEAVPELMRDIADRCEHFVTGGQP
ncbi:MAG: tyrosine-type recombinase/integrase [Acidobacteria bacterium]|nr:tyrosine-type recombinase/integrase [Acidobacteriota bacterium]